ncbi:MAG: VCBS repeat-containing protein, partial [bacterium]|nr:VCBS repeat-containing protein [bacterium]
WAEHVVEEPVETVHHFIGVADFEGDGADDIATAAMEQGADPDEVTIFLNAGGGESWKKLVLSETASHSMRIADIDGDGDMDLYGANWRGRSVEWWDNRLR